MELFYHITCIEQNVNLNKSIFIIMVYFKVFNMDDLYNQ
jgi:hypothetical protein